MPFTADEVLDRALAHLDPDGTSNSDAPTDEPTAPAEPSVDEVDFGWFAWSKAPSPDVPGVGGMVVDVGITSDGRRYLTVLDETPQRQDARLPRRVVRQMHDKGDMVPVRLVTPHRLFLADVEPSLSQEATAPQLGGWASKALSTAAFLKGPEQFQLVVWAGLLTEKAQQR